jgi:hypothetical protein
VATAGWQGPRRARFAASRAGTEVRCAWWRKEMAVVDGGRAK